MKTENVSIVDHETGQCPGRLADILFAIVSDTQCEQFHQFASQVFVGMSLAVVGGIQPDQ